MRSFAMTLSVASLLTHPAYAESRAGNAAVAEAIRSPRIAARERVDNAVIAGDMAAIEAGLSSETVLNGPNNRINDGATIIANIAAGRVGHETLVRSIEYAAECGRDVVFMGEETTSARGDRGDNIVRRRRFTDVWTQTPDGWKITMRQATIYQAE